MVAGPNDGPVSVRLAKPALETYIRCISPESERDLLRYERMSIFDVSKPLSLGSELGGRVAMQTEFSDDQQQFRQVVGRFLDDKSTTADVRRLIESESGYDHAVWQQLSQELGLAGLHIPQAYGGLGFGAVELGIVAEEMGRTLFCGPYLASSVMAGYALLAGATQNAKSELLPGLAAGETIATLVLDSLDSPSEVGSRIAAGSDHLLSGQAPIVVDGQTADLLIVIASHDGERALYVLPAKSPGVRVTPRQSLDPTRRIAAIEFDRAQAQCIGAMTDGALLRLWDDIVTALAHEMMGGARQLFESTVDYTQVRVQFGRPIGSFQALKHRCADLLMELEFAKAATHHAAFCAAADEGEPWAASMAKAMASDVYMEAGRAAVQLRGGIGFTWEEDTHLWFKRAKSSEVLMGGAHLHRERVVALMEEQP